MPDVRLKVGGALYGGWQEIRIQRSIEQIAGRFDLSVTERWADSDEPRPIRPGEECQVLIDGEPVITGYVDDVSINYDKESHTVAVSGRDRTGDLVDCSAPVQGDNQYFTRPLIDLVKRLCKPYDIEVSADTDTGGPFKQFAWSPGDSVFEVIEQAARIRAVLLVSDGLGGLLLTRASTERIAAVLELGENVLACSATFSGKDRYRDYTVLSQQPGDDFGTSDHSAQPSGKAHDASILRHRPLVVRAELPSGVSGAKMRAEWERNVRFGRSQRLIYTLQGWHYASDEIWPINRLVTVRDSLLFGFAVERLISGVTLIVDSSGVRTELSLMPREAFDLVSLPEKEGKGWETL